MTHRLPAVAVLVLAAVLAAPPALAHLGSEAQVLEAWRDLCERSGADACYVERDGRVLLRWEGPRYDPDDAAMMSSTKSIAAMLIMALVEDGKLKSIDEPVGRYVPEWATGPRAAVTVRHLLSHTAGLALMHGRDTSVGFRRGKSAYVRGLIPAHPPGVRFSYSNEGVQLLSPLIEAAAGEPVNAYAARRLFGPLGLAHTRFYESPPGDAWTYGDMLSRPEEFARFGRLMLDGGMWRGKRILSRWSVDQLTAQAQPFDPTCGLLWWREPQFGGFATHGYRATHMHVFPRNRTIAVRIQGGEGPMTERAYTVAARPLLRRLAGLPHDPAEGWTAPLELANEALGSGRPDDALRHASAVLARRDADVASRAEAHLYAGFAAHKLGRLDEARGHLTAFRALAPQLPPGHWGADWADTLEGRLAR